MEFCFDNPTYNSRTVVPELTHVLQVPNSHYYHNLGVTKPQTIPVLYESWAGSFNFSGITLQS